MNNNNSSSHCIFCFKHSDYVEKTCTYGLGHEYPEGFTPGKTAPVVEKKVKIDTQICVECGLHFKNPASAKSNCEHSYEVEIE